LVFDDLITSVDISSLSPTVGTYTFSFLVKSTHAAGGNDYLFDSSNGRLTIGFLTGSGASTKIGYYDFTGAWHDLDDAPADGKWHNIDSLKGTLDEHLQQSALTRRSDRPHRLSPDPMTR